MIPTNTASTTPVASAFLSPDDKVTNALVDYERGGVAIGDASQGLSMQDWVGRMVDIDFRLKPDNGPEFTLFQVPNVTEVSFCFDQNMRPAVVYLSNGIMFLRWFDSVINGYRTDSFGVTRNPRATLDDKRLSQILNSDIIIAYISGTNLCYRQQRERFGVERVLRTGLRSTDRLKNLGMGRNWRLQWEIV